MLRISLGQDQPLFGPGASGYTHGIVLDAVLGRLFYPSKNPANDVMGLLAGGSSNSDGACWNLSLKSGLKFQNGREVTSTDLEYTLASILLSTNRTPNFIAVENILGAHKAHNKAFYNGCIEGIKTLGKLDLEIRLKTPDLGFLKELKTGVYAPIPIEETLTPGSELDGPSASSGAHISWKKAPVGCGPYRVVSYAHDRKQLVLEKFKDFELQAYRAEKVELFSNSQRTDLDIVRAKNNPDPKRFEEWSSSRTAGTAGVYFNFHHPLARDQRFRRALNLILDPKEISVHAPGSRPTWSMIPSEWEMPRVGAKRLDQSEAATTKQKNQNQAINPPI